jgi:serine/threonine-protein kinase
MSFLGELKRRNVVRMALLYVVAGWVMLQIADVLFVPLGLPEWAFRLVFGLLLLGFPFALIFAWVFELTPEGLKRERDVDRSRSVAPRTGRRMNAIIAVLLVVAIAGVVADRLLPEAVPPRADAAAAPGGNAPGVDPAGPAATDPTLAVLPFVNMSDDPENEYFSDGLTEELLNTLVRIGGLKVTGRTSSFVFKGQSRDLREVGELLNVANVLEGSVRKAGNRVRITAQLVKTSDGYHLWSDTFDRELDDIFAIQREIADQVSRAMHSALVGGTPVDSAVPEPPVNVEAFEEYLRGMYTWQRDADGRPSLERARAHFEQALALAPEYVDANWGLFRTWDRLNRNGHGPFDQSHERMQFYAAELQRLEPGSDHALSAAARLALVDYDYPRAVAYLDEAQRRNPDSADLLAQLGASVVLIGDYGRAQAALEQAARLDPLSLDVMRFQAFALHRAGDCTGVERVLRRVLELEPGVARVHYYLAMCIFETTGDAARALPFAEREPLGWAHQTALAILLHALGDMERAQQSADNLVVSTGDASSYQLGQIYAQWGDTETALEWLEKALEVRDPGIVQAGDDRLLAPLQGEPRFEQILREAGHR